MNWLAGSERGIAQRREARRDDVQGSQPFVNLLKSLLHNIGVVLVGLAFAYVGTRLDALLELHGFHAGFATFAAWPFLIVGFLLRVWATFVFYECRMKVISLAAQGTLITSGPFRFSRNPLYLGGNVFIFFGAALLLGTPSGVLLVALHLPLMDLFVRREEKQLEQRFGEDWIRYRSQVRRWL
jgi:protein-S-isoprenylcysteine O-methyltransferase Ste14